MTYSPSTSVWSNSGAIPLDGPVYLIFRNKRGFFSVVETAFNRPGLIEGELIKRGEVFKVVNRKHQCEDAARELGWDKSYPLEWW